MRALGWCLVALGLITAFFTVMAIRTRVADYAILCREGWQWACGATWRKTLPEFDVGFTAAAIVLGFGILLLALRQPRHGK